MPPKRTHESRTNPSHGVPADNENLMFIHQRPESFSTNSRRTVALVMRSQARRWYTNQKHRDQRVLARQEAGYARSLVGWARSTPSTSEEMPLVPRTTASHRQFQTIAADVSGGLRVDPFDALPIQRSEAMTLAIDYCMSAPLAYFFILIVLSRPRVEPEEYH